jgi:hypothetical protein
VSVVVSNYESPLKSVPLLKKATGVEKEVVGLGTGLTADTLGQ